MRYSTIVQRLYYRVTRRVRAVRYRECNDYFPVFICGMMGSGTTLITRLIEQHYIVGGVANETARNMPRGSPLRIKSTHDYRSLPEYTRDLILPEQCSPELVRSYSVKYYRGTMNGGADSNIVLDKAPAAHLARARHLRAAFPDSKFVLVFRDPCSSIEGLRRKWLLFARASLTDVCDFWRLLHVTFMENAEGFSQDVVGVLLDDLLQNPARVFRAVEGVIPGLIARKELKLYKDRPDREGYGVRNVRDGRIVVVKDASQRASTRLCNREREVIRKHLWPVYERLHEMLALS